MRATADTIWQVPVYLPYLQPALTKRAVSAVEKAIGHKLPAEYLELLKVQNGGYIRYSLPEFPHSKIKGIGPHFPALKAEDWEEDQEHVTFPLEGLVPFDGDGHWHLCLDYRLHPDNPAVTFIDISGDDQSPVAPSCAEYLDLLEPARPEGFVIEGVSDIGATLAALSKALRVTFEPPESWNYGYPVHRAGLGSERNPEWIWVSPNEVPRGFVRPDDSRYEELKDLLPGTALRFPDQPAECCIMSVTEQVRSRVLKACAESGVMVRPADGAT